jgi:hypothetical protein
MDDFCEALGIEGGIGVMSGSAAMPSNPGLPLPPPLLSSFFDEPWFFLATRNVRKNLDRVEWRCFFVETRAPRGARTLGTQCGHEQLLRTWRRPSRTIGAHVLSPQSQKHGALSNLTE